MADSQEPCLICGRTPTDEAHWPYTRRYGDATVPLCREHHTAAHWARQDVIEKLIVRAPGYWRSVGEWERNIDAYERWMSKRRYLAWTRWPPSSPVSPTFRARSK